MLRAILFVVSVLLFYALAVSKGPLYGLIAYAIIYFIPPSPEIHWWSEFIPFTRWSLLSSGVLVVSFLFHRSKLVKRNFKNANWLFLFTFLSLVTVFVSSGFGDSSHAYKLLTYCFTVWFIIKAIKDEEQLRTFLISIVILAGVLSILAYMEGERINDRLEGIGANDSFEANQFALLLAGILPLMLPLILHGRKYEKIACFIFLPFILNAFILCNSRGAAIALVGGLVFSTFMVADKQIRKKVIIAAIIVFPVFLHLTDPAYISRISSLWTSEEAMEGGEALNQLSSGRTEIWSYGLKMVQDYPLGAGPNSFKNLARFYMPVEVLTFHPGAQYGVRAAHNTYLQILVEQGYLGFIVWILLSIHTLFVINRAAKRLKQDDRSNSFMGFITFGLSASFVCSLLGGLTMSRIYYEFFWWQVAFSVVAFSIIHETETDRAKC